MNENIIKDILEKHNINAKNIKKANNSFSSDVYIISNDNEKFVLKMSTNKEKIENEKKYYNHLYNFLPTSKIICNGTYKDFFYLIISYFEGNNRYDYEGNDFSDHDLKKLGELLAKLHNCELLDDNNNWIKYLNKCINKSINSLKEVLKDDYLEVVIFAKKYLEKRIVGNYENCIIHTDFRIGNVIFGDDEVGLIDMESIKCGDYIFDFVKISRILNKKNFNIFLEGYLKIRSIDNYFYKRLKFYSFFDSIISVEWCKKNDRLDTDYYKNNYNFLLKYAKEIKDGKWNI